MSAVGWAQAIVLLVAAQRLGELALAWRNDRRLRADGAVEHGRGHYPLLVALHAGWLAAIFVAVSPERPPSWLLLALFAAMQAVRFWVIASLGRYWTTRVLVAPGQALVRRGPYRWMRHPNYAVVVAEIALLPLVFGAWRIAVAFSVANALLLAWRIRIEERALRSG